MIDKVFLFSQCHLQSVHLPKTSGDDGNDDGEESDDGDDDGEDDVDHHLKGKEKEKGNTPGLGETRTS